MAVAVLAASLTFAGPCALAQQQADILVVNWDRVLNESMAGRDIVRQTQELNARMEAEVMASQQTLAAEEEELAAKRESMDPIDFEARVRAFEVKIEDFRRDVQARSALAETAFRNAFGRLSEIGREARYEVLRERGATLMFDVRVLLAHDAVDATAAVIEALDGKVTTIPLEFPDSAGN